ncbi:hypothetical protein IV102_04615, partial [bacterium]|nr:hypothetical protein [bacterium]
KAITPAASEGPPEEAGFGTLKTELKRLMIGNQAGIVKVLGPNREGVAYARGIDDQSLARINHEDCHCVFSALGVHTAKIMPLAQYIMINYSSLPHKEAVAILSVAACSPALDASTREKAEQFLVQVMETDKDVHARRQAILALAVQPQVTLATTDRVIRIYEHSENLWETFPVQQYFQYHAAQLRRQQNFGELRQRVAGVNSLYTPAILNYLDHP